ncbi:MAG: peptide chain release factor N(5)-glutamine methyltransferase [Lachnospiraceae bacterium]|nr:peptide chain release factor N(5)-glutamine methyltransferase [Lachnospiraceae bacterium]
MPEHLYRETYEEGVGFLSMLNEAALDARLLLEAVCGTAVSDLFSRPERPVSDEEYEEYLHYLELRAGRMPVAYILGAWEFMGLSFLVSQDVLIPNQDTELLVEEAMKSLSGGMRILDLCTGSGCILLSLLHYSCDTTGVGTDISGDALAIASANAEKLGLSERCTFLQGDLFGAMEQPEEGREQKEQKFDMIVSNPPYIPSGDIASLEPEVGIHEPRISLDGGPDGLLFYRKIAAMADRFMRPGGYIYLETGFDQTEDVSALLAGRGFTEIKVFSDYGGNPRVVCARKGVM